MNKIKNFRSHLGNPPNRVPKSIHSKTHEKVITILGLLNASYWSIIPFEMVNYQEMLKI